MAYQSIYDKFDYVYRGFWNEYGTKEINHLPLVAEGPWKLLGIVAVYLWFVKIKGPQMMKNREAMEIKPYILAYNIFLVALHGCLLPVGIWGSDYGTSTLSCRKVDLINAENNPKESIAVILAYTYFVTKFVELLDTVFFILRKKTNQVTNLHVFHHSMMPVFCFIAAKFSPWHTVGFVVLLNSTVHVVMYLYYTFALLNLKHLLWLKKHITQMQITQFVLIIIHAIYFLQNKDCEWPKIFPFMQLMHGLLFLYLFSSFYYVTYIRKKPEKQN